MKKNTASQRWVVFAFDRTDSTPKTGDAAQISAKIALDGAAAAATNDVAPTELEDGFYEFDLTQAETNADELWLTPESSTSDIQVIGVPGVIYPEDNATATDLATVDTVVDGIKAVTDVLPDSGALSSLATAAALTTVDTVVDGIQTDLDNGTDGLGALKTLIDAVDTVVDSILADTGTDGVVLSSATCNKITDHAWRRSYADIRASSDGDTVTGRSGLGMLAALVNKTSAVTNPGSLEIFHEDDATVFITKTITSDAGAAPITALDTV
tara:strand:+ start:291 stop:1097 length:807 start_codon:yes stop_codon:yes gene_type:complete